MMEPRKVNRAEIPEGDAGTGGIDHGIHGLPRMGRGDSQAGFLDGGWGSCSCGLTTENVEVTEEDGGIVHGFHGLPRMGRGDTRLRWGSLKVSLEWQGFRGGTGSRVRARVVGMPLRHGIGVRSERCQNRLARPQPPGPLVVRLKLAGSSSKFRVSKGCCFELHTLL
jgi:hypothetical protein